MTVVGGRPGGRHGTRDEGAGMARVADPTRENHGSDSRAASGAPMSSSARQPSAGTLQGGASVTTVLICDDRRSVREGLTRVMSAVPGVHRIDCVAHGDALLPGFSRQSADVALVGTQRAVPPGVGATRRLVAAHPQANVIVFG